MKTNTIIINMGESYRPKRVNIKYNWRKHLKSKSNPSKVRNMDDNGNIYHTSENNGAWIALDFHSRGTGAYQNQTKYIDKHGIVHDHASLQRLTDKGYRLYFK